MAACFFYVNPTVLSNFDLITDSSAPELQLANQCHSVANEKVNQVYIAENIPKEYFDQHNVQNVRYFYIFDLVFYAQNILN